MKVEKPCGGVLQSNHPNWVPRLILDLCRIENCDFFDIYHHVCRSLWCTPCIHESKDNHFENTFSWNKNLTFRQRTLTWEIVPFFFLTKKLCFLASNHLAMYSQMLGNKSCRFEMTSKDTVPSYSFTMQSKTAFLEGAHSWTELFGRLLNELCFAVSHRDFAACFGDAETFGDGLVPFMTASAASKVFVSALQTSGEDSQTLKRTRCSFGTKVLQRTKSVDIDWCGTRSYCLRIFKLWESVRSRDKEQEHAELRTAWEQKWGYKHESDVHLPLVYSCGRLHATIFLIVRLGYLASPNRPFYRYGSHIDLIRLKEYYRMPRGHEHISFVLSSAFRDIFS